MIKTLLLSLMLSLLVSTGVHAKIQTQKVEYKAGDLTFEGFLAYDSAIKGKKPGVMIVGD